MNDTLSWHDYYTTKLGVYLGYSFYLFRQNLYSFVSESLQVFDHYHAGSKFTSVGLRFQVLMLVEQRRKP